MELDKHFPYSAPGSTGRLSLVISDLELEHRLYNLFPTTPLMRHHVKALLPNVRLAIDVLATEGVDNQRALSVALRLLWEVRYWSARSNRVRDFDTDVTGKILNDVCVPVADKIVRWRNGEERLTFEEYCYA